MSRAAWFYQEDGLEVGPWTAEQLRTMAAAGQLRPSTLVRGPSNQWIPAEKISGLFDSRPTKPQKVETADDLVAAALAEVKEKQTSPETPSPSPDGSWGMMNVANAGRPYYRSTPKDAGLEIWVYLMCLLVCVLSLIFFASIGGIVIFAIMVPFWSAVGAAVGHGAKNRWADGLFLGATLQLIGVLLIFALEDRS